MITDVDPHTVHQDRSGGMACQVITLLTAVVKRGGKDRRDQVGQLLGKQTQLSVAPKNLTAVNVRTPLHGRCSVAPLLASLA